MKIALALSILCLSVGGIASAAETPRADRAAVLKVVNSFFEAMQARDVETIRNIYQPQTQFVWRVPSPGGVNVQQGSVEAFIQDVEAAPQPFLERIWSPTVNIEGGVAVVWARYDFHRGAKFSHNGRDCYVLLKTSDGWKIVSLVFSVEPGVRTENPLGPPRP